MSLGMTSYLIPVVGRYSRTLQRTWVMIPKIMASIVRSGGVTSVVSNDLSHNDSERFLMLRGRWKSDKAKDMYILEPQGSRLRVTKYLGIVSSLTIIYCSLEMYLKKANKSVRVFMRSPIPRCTCVYGYLSGK